MSGLNSVLTGLQNPTQPDLVGSFQEGRSEGLQGKILAETFGGKLGALGTADPKAAMELATQLGIPKNEKERFQSFVGTIQTATALVNGPGGVPAAMEALSEHRDKVILNPNADTSRIDRMIQFLELEPESGSEALNLMNKSLIEQNFLKDPGGDTKFSASTVSLPGGLTQQNDSRGGITVTRGDGTVLTGQDAQDAIDAAETKGSERKLLEVREGANARATATRTSEIKQEFSQRARDSSREQITLNQAMKLVDKADQGLLAAGKLQMARIFPDIDVTDEAQLGQALTGLALDQLQKFKGPTTDFEFGVTESIAGRISDPKSANKARIKSLNRANWFNRRESNQFNKFIKSGGDPDEFRFNFAEQVKTKKGKFSLRDLQDTAIDKNMTIDEVLRELNK